MYDAYNTSRLEEACYTTTIVLLFVKICWAYCSHDICNVIRTRTTTLLSVEEFQCCTEIGKTPECQICRHQARLLCECAARNLLS